MPSKCDSAGFGENSSNWREVVQLLFKKPLLNPVELGNLAELVNPALEIFPIVSRQVCTPLIKASLQFGLMASTWGTSGNCNSEGLWVTTPYFLPIEFLDQETLWSLLSFIISWLDGAMCSHGLHLKINQKLQMLQNLVVLVVIDVPCSAHITSLVLNRYLGAIQDICY